MIKGALFLAATVSMGIADGSAMAGDAGHGAIRQVTIARPASSARSAKGATQRDRDSGAWRHDPRI